MKLEFDKQYRFKGQPQVLVYIGKKRGWHQFERVESPHRVWCELTDDDLVMIEPVKEEKND